ncbi:MAG: MFS transporter [Victivallaceae bacterium]|nr:MFS transporter [Victivallaceae bacterium]
MPRSRRNTWIYFPLVGVTLVYFCACLQKVIVPGATFSDIQSLFHLGIADTVRLGAAFYFVYASLQLAAGPLADRFGGAKVVAVAGFIFAAGSLISALAVSGEWLLASRIIVGAGAAMMAQALLEMTSRIAGEKLPVVFGVVTMLGYSGSIIGTTPFIAGVAAFGYRAMMMAAAVLAGIAYVLHLAGCSSGVAGEGQKRAPFSIAGWFRCFTRQNILFFFAMGIPFATTFSFLTIFGKKFLEDYARMTSAQAGAILFGMTLVAAVNGIVAAVVSRRFGNNHLLIMRCSSVGSFILTIALSVLLAMRCHSPLPIGIIALMLASTGNILPVYAAYLRENNDPNFFVTVNSIMNGCAYVFTSFAAWGAGKLMGFFPQENVGGVLRCGENAYLAIALGMVLFSTVSVACTFALRPRKKA